MNSLRLVCVTHPSIHSFILKTTEDYPSDRQLAGQGNGSDEGILPWLHQMRHGCSNRKDRRGRKGDGGGLLRVPAQISFRTSLLNEMIEKGIFRKTKPIPPIDEMEEEKRNFSNGMNDDEGTRRRRLPDPTGSVILPLFPPAVLFFFDETFPLSLQDRNPHRDGETTAIRR